MAKALQPAVTAGEISFELDRFELGSSGRLDLSGRWFGVRGMRFVRPTLIIRAEQGHVRALADLEHKPWAAEDGNPWEASFAWDYDAEILGAELAVASDVVVQLPAPGAASGGSQRLVAAPERERAAPAAAVPAAAVPAAAATELATEAPAPPRRPRRARPDAETERLRETLEATRAELEATRAELEAARAELEAARAERAEAEATAEAASLEAASAIARRDAAVSSADEALAARDAALAASAEMTDARDRERQLRDRLAAERDEARAALERLESELGQARAELQRATEHQRAASQARDQAVGERDQLIQSSQQASTAREAEIAARGAALVMRNAARGNPSFERDAGWFRRVLAIGVLVVAAFALLIILHAL